MMRGMGGNKNQPSGSVVAWGKKCLTLMFFIIGLAFFTLSILADAHYRENRPAKPQPDHGRIYATRLSKDVWVYLTRKEELVYELLTPLSVISIFISIVLNIWWKPFPAQQKMKHNV
jgi:hypothetical protein